MYDRCKIFTPNDFANFLLDLIDYKDNLYGKKILENSCGDGNIIKLIVCRYINDCIHSGYKLSEIKNGLERDIYAFEINDDHCNTCIRNLDNLAEHYGIYSVDWNIKKEDFLKSSNSILFDYITGNPPYISYRDLNIETRQLLSTNFYSCNEGKFDYCYAFIEKSINQLNENGKMSYLVPNSILKNVFAQRLRELLITELIEIYDYTSKKIFQKATTSSVILKIKKNNHISHIKYFDTQNPDNNTITKKSKLIGKWFFNNKYNSQKNVTVFGDLFKISNSIATLANSVYVLKNVQEWSNEYYKYKDFLIEKAIVRRAASPRGSSYDIDEYIIFPYWYNNKKNLIKFKDDEFSNLYPKATDYLMSNIKILQKRDSDSSAKWFEYGRSQALKHLNQQKILMSSLTTNKIHLYFLDEDVIPYSGFFITAKLTESLKYAKKILESPDFLEYVNITGINANGVSKRITVKDIANFPIPSSLLRRAYEKVKIHY